MRKITDDRLEWLIRWWGGDTHRALRELRDYRKAVREYLEAVDVVAGTPYEIDSGQRRIAALNDRDAAEATLRALKERT